MAKDKINPTESRSKRNNFFIKAKAKQLRTQTQPFNSIKISIENSEKSKNFFIKNISDSKVSDVPKTIKNKEENYKKPFDKKKWRLQKYSKKYKLQQWEESRKKAILKEYYKETKNDQPSSVKIYEEEVEENNFSNVGESENENNLNSEVSTSDNYKSTGNPPHLKKKKPYLNPYGEYQRLKEERTKRKDELRRKKEERDKVLKEYKKEKIQKYKRLNKKTKKGQPIMKFRMQMLLEQIQQSTN